MQIKKFIYKYITSLLDAEYVDFIHVKSSYSMPNIIFKYVTYHFKRPILHEYIISMYTG